MNFARTSLHALEAKNGVMNMEDIRQDLYYRRLAKLSLWPAVSLIFLTLVVTICLWYVLKAIYIPAVMLPLEQNISAELAGFIEHSIMKVATTLTTWILILLVVNSLLVYVIWNVRRLIMKLELIASQEQKATLHTE